MNPIGHVPNITGQGLFAVSRENPVTGVPKWGYNMLTHGLKIAMDEGGDEFRYYKSLGSNIGDEMTSHSYGEQPGGVVNTINRGLDATQGKATALTWKYDVVAKTGAYKTLIDQGVEPREAIAFVDRYMGDYRNISPGIERTISSYGATFYPWLKTEMQPLINAKKYPLALVGGLAWSLGAITAVNAAYRQFTGNPDAKLNVVGGTGKLATDAVEQLNPHALQQDYEQAKLPPLVYSHIGKPILRTGIQQVADHNFLTGKQITDPTESPSASLQTRGKAALGQLNPAGGQAVAASEGKKSVPEAVANAFGFSSTPHLKGYQAAPNVAFFNTSGAKEGTGMEIIHNQDKMMSSLSSQERQQYKSLSQLQAQNTPESTKQYRDILIGNQKYGMQKHQLKKQVLKQLEDKLTHYIIYHTMKRKIICNIKICLGRIKGNMLLMTHQL
jgi:hypothetical protein